jgi:WhiB family redox-sensing transcriptional regulator
LTISEHIVPADFPDFSEYGATPCSQIDPEAFFPVDETPGSLLPSQIAYQMEREAKLVCVECPYQVRCLEYAIRNPGEQGIWGGTTEFERKSFRRGKPIRLRIPPIKRG